MIKLRLIKSLKNLKKMKKLNCILIKRKRENITLFLLGDYSSIRSKKIRKSRRLIRKSFNYMQRENNMVNKFNRNFIEEVE